MRLVDLRTNNVDIDITRGDLEEKDAPMDYVRFMDNTAKKRPDDSKLILLRH